MNTTASDALVSAARRVLARYEFEDETDELEALRAALERFESASPQASQEAEDLNGGKTGHPPGMLQDDSRQLSKWLASKPDARQRAREACADIEASRPLPAGAAPTGWEIERGVGWVGVLNTSTKCGQNFYEDRDPLIFAFLRALDVQHFSGLVLKGCKGLDGVNADNCLPQSAHAQKGKPE